MASSTQQYTDNGYDLAKLDLVSNQGGKTIDLRPQLAEICIYESIFDGKVVGEILLKDGLNYSEVVPIVGNESIFISYKTLASDGEFVQISGRVVAPLGKARTTNEKTEVYKLQFVSNTNFRNRLTHVHASYKGTISDIISSLYNEYLGVNSTKLKSVDLTKGIHQFIFPYWTPLFAITWLSERAYYDEASCFVFYEGVDGHHFRDIMRAAKKSIVMSYKVEPNNGSNTSDVNRFIEQVQSYSITSYLDRLSEYAKGMYSGILQTHDITTKKVSTTEMDYQDLFDAGSHLNEYPFFPPSNMEFRNNKTFKNYMPVQLGKLPGIRKNEDPEKYFLNRESIQAQFSTFRITILVPGNSALRLLDTVEFTIPKIGYMDSDEEDWKDPYLSGKYIVTSIMTSINITKGYRCSIELAKDSLVKGIPDKIENK